jgi:cell division protease FtsH
MTFESQLTRTSSGEPSPGHPDDDPVEVVRYRGETRKPMVLWDRVKLLLLIAVVWGVVLWSALSNDPLLSVHDAVIQQIRTKWWLEALFGLELLRQVHYLISEHVSWWHRAWTYGVIGRLHARSLRLSDWTRYRLGRIFTIVVVVAAVAIIAGAAWHTTPIDGLFQLPSKLYHALPFVFQIIAILLLAVGQFAMIFWFLSRGGTDVYFPDDIRTRFSDVWGQDAVLDRVKETLVFLDDPAAIEDRGGYVPGGILLWGPPGTGKTLMAEAVAGETGKPFVFVDPGAFINMFFGVGVLKVKSLFRKLRKLAVRYGGVIVFFDEADSLGNRGLLRPGGIFGPGGVSGAETLASQASSAPAHPSIFDQWGGCHGGSYLSPNSVSQLLQSNFRVNGMMPVMGGAGGGGGGGMGTLQALLTELSGLKKPRGFMNRVVRRVLGFPPKAPPKYRIMVVMATNMPQALDEALLRPGRLDRIYKVGYPSKAGRVRTYQGYLNKVANDLTPDQIDRLATVTPYATGATIKDLVNEALILSIRDGRDLISWPDILRAKQLKELGLPEDVEYVERERHAVAVHEACHAVVAYRVRHHLQIDVATIEKGGSYLGMVASIKPEDRFTTWRSEYESDVMVALGSLAGERLFFAGDSSSGVSGDLESATTIASLMEGYWGMGSTIASHGVTQQIGAGGRGGPPRDNGNEKGLLHGDLGQRIESKLTELLTRTEHLITDNRREVLALAHALESHKTLSGEDVQAVMGGETGPVVDGRVYADPRFLPVIEQYHRAHVDAHLRQLPVGVPLPGVADWIPESATSPDGYAGSAWGAPAAMIAVAGDGWSPNVPSERADPSASS